MARELFVGKAYEEVGEEIEVGATLGELRHVYGELAKTMVEVFTEAAFGYCLLQILVGGSHKTDVDGALLGAAQRTHTTLLQGTQQLHLHLVAQIAHLIEKQRSAIGCLESSTLVGIGTREGSLLVSEELRRCHITRYGTAVECHERFAGTLALLVYATRNILLARARGSEYEHRHRRWRDKTDVAVELAGRVAFPLDVSRGGVEGLRGCCGVI